MAETIYYDKLVRDKIPEIIVKNGATPIYEAIGNREALYYANDKLKEEYNEYIKECYKPFCPYEDSKESAKEELADMLEVFCRVVALNGFTVEEIEEARKKKNEKNGAFENNYILHSVIK